MDYNSVEGCIFESGTTFIVDGSPAPTIIKNTIKSGASLKIYTNVKPTGEGNKNVIVAGATVSFPSEHVTIRSGVWYAIAGAIVNEVELKANQWIENVPTGE